MEQIVVKTEVQPNGDILLFYVDEHEEADVGVLENEQEDVMQMLPETKYVIEDNGEGESADELDIAQAADEVAKEIWLDEEIKRLIVFYIDNKETFLSGTTKKKHLWAVACRTMLTGKNPVSCEVKLRMLKQQFIQVCLEKQKGNIVTWPYFDLCHQAFYEDSVVNVSVNEPEATKVVINMPVQNVVNQDGVLVVKKVNTNHGKEVDEKVEAMLKLYIKHKQVFKRNHHMPRGLWETIALEMGEEDVEYWHKRFLNFKQHYVRMLYKKKESGPDGINWPYMKYFDHIFGDDEEFHKKFVQNDNDDDPDNPDVEIDDNSWSDTEKTFLVKYYFDCFHEFQDPTIPNKFLWQEVGRLLDAKPEECKNKYNELKTEHYTDLVDGGYDMTNRVPMAIIFDNVIAKETVIELEHPVNRSDSTDIWQTEQIDELVQYLYDNINMLKDSICYYVCWATIAKKIDRSVKSCIKQWDILKTLYKSILEDKKENSDMQIDWRYIDLFDRIFDYGMDVNLLDGYEKSRELSNGNNTGKVGVKKITIKNNDEMTIEGSDDEESYDERGFTKRSKKRNGDAKAFKILEYYLKNKDKFSSSQQKKLALWEILAKQIGISATECAHRFRNFKQVYTGYVQREINKPEMPILWPYYTLCKKVFGYRAIKSKLKNGKMESEDGEDWSAKEIKQLINFFSRNYHNLADNIEDKNRWTLIAQDIGRTENSCRDKFLELRKSYRKLKTMKSRNPDVKVSWKYFNMIDEIYQNGAENVEVLEEMEVDDPSVYDVKTEMHEDDDFQCIIVIPEGEDIHNAQIIIQDEGKQMENSKDFFAETKRNITVWNRRSKKRLLILHLKYLRIHKGMEISSRDMWTEISSQLEEKTPASCRKMLIKLKNQYKLDKESSLLSPYQLLLDKILAFKPKYAKCNKTKVLEDITVYNDVPMSDDKVSDALNYYLQNLEDFVSPKFEKNYLWTELASFISEPVTNIYTKINYLKQNFDNDVETPFREILQVIVAKENALKDDINKDLNPAREEEAEEQNWSDLEIERLLTWYLAHLDKFKNPKFVRSYLWMEASDILKKSPLVCSKKMLEIRSQYRSMVRENPEELNNWKFYNLCQRIYGTGKKSN